MRRLLFLSCACIVLASCRGAAALPPDDVIQRAARASQELNSARFFLVAVPRWDYAGTQGALTVSVDGRLTDGGDQVQFLASIQGDIQSSDPAAIAVTSAVVVVVAGPQEVYVNVHTLETQPPAPALVSPALGEFKGQWLRLSAPAPLPHVSVASDPKLLALQSSVITVTRDRGVRPQCGRMAYHYDVQLNAENLLAFLQEVARSRAQSFDPAVMRPFFSSMTTAGEIFIDAETFVIHRLIWKIALPSPPVGTFSLDITLDLRDHGLAPPILPPKDAKPFPDTLPSINFLGQ